MGVPIAGDSDSGEGIGQVKNRLIEQHNASPRQQRSAATIAILRCLMNLETRRYWDESGGPSSPFCAGGVMPSPTSSAMNSSYMSKSGEWSQRT